MSRLTTKSRRGPSGYKPGPLPNPQGYLPAQVKQIDYEVRTLLKWSHSAGDFRNSLHSIEKAARALAHLVVLRHLAALKQQVSGSSQSGTLSCTVHTRELLIQASKHLAARLGWSLDASGTAGAVEADACTDKIQALFCRAQYYKQGKIIEKDSGKAFVPDWEAMARDQPVQAELVADMVCFADFAHLSIWHGRLPSREHVRCSGKPCKDPSLLQAKVMEAANAVDPERQPVDLVHECTVLLSNLTDPEMQFHSCGAFRDKPPEDQLMLFYRAVRGQEFLARQRAAVTHKEEWIDLEAQRAMVPRKVVSKAAQDAFYQRLMHDADKRAATKAAAISAQLAKEAALLKSSKLWGISHKLCRSP
jgi:hypothetical protein